MGIRVLAAEEETNCRVKNFAINYCIAVTNALDTVEKIVLTHVPDVTLQLFMIPLIGNIYISYSDKRGEGLYHYIILLLYNINHFKSFRYIKLPCKHSVKNSELLERLQNVDLAEIPSCSICLRPISHISRSFKVLNQLLLRKKKAVIKVFEESFVLKSTIEQKKKELVLTCK